MTEKAPALNPALGTLLRDQTILQTGTFTSGLRNFAPNGCSNPVFKAILAPETARFGCLESRVPVLLRIGTLVPADGYQCPCKRVPLVLETGPKTYITI